MTPANDNDPMTGKQINSIRKAAGMSVSELYAKAPLQTGMMSLSHFNPSILPRTSPF